MEALPGLWSLTPIGGMIGMIALFYWLLASGRIITQSSHERELGMSNKRGDDYKSLYETADKRATVLEEQIGRTVVKILDALPVPNSGGRRDS